jgi:hypothetical protein
MTARGKAARRGRTGAEFGVDGLTEVRPQQEMPRFSGRAVSSET